MMLNERIIEELFNHYYMRNFSIESQTQIIQIFEDIIRNERLVNAYATISELLDE